VIILALCVPVLLGFPGRGFNKATKKDELIFMSTEKEKIIGLKISKQVEEKFSGPDDPLVQERIEKIGEKVSAVCERKDVIFRFKVISDPEEEIFNAFALPGGYIYIFDDMVKAMETDDRIAAILAHEVGHVAAKHSIKRLQSALGMNALLLLGVGMSASGGASGRDVAEASNALSHLMASYSREAEVEADMLSVRYLREAGFDPGGVVGALLCLQAMRKKGPIRRYMYFRTHPYLSERLSRAKMEVNGQMDFNSFMNLPKEGEEFY